MHGSYDLRSVRHPQTVPSFVFYMYVLETGHLNLTTHKEAQSNKPKSDTHTYPLKQHMVTLTQTIYQMES